MVYITVLSPYIELDAGDSIKPLIKVLYQTNNWIKKYIHFKIVKYYYTTFDLINLIDCIKLIKGFPASSLLYDRECRQDYETFTVNTGNYILEVEGVCREYSPIIVKFIFKLNIEGTKIVAEITQ